MATAMGMACELEVWACALCSVGGGGCDSGIRVEVEVEPCAALWSASGLLLVCLHWSARICVGRQGWLLHSMQTGRGTVEHSTSLAGFVHGQRALD